MLIAKGKGQNCDPINFSEEVMLSFNLPPLHMLDKSFIPEIVSHLAKHTSGKEIEDQQV